MTADPTKNSKRAARRPASPAAPGLTLSTAWVAVLLALLTVVFFREVALEGRTFVSPDATAPLGFVRMGEQSLWQDHVYPLWNPFTFLGMPSFGSGAYNPLIYPPDWPLALIERVVPLPEMTWMILYYFLGAFFLYLLAREWGARSEGAMIAAVAFIFQPNLVAVGSHGHGSQLVDSAYLPLMLWLASRWMKRGTTPELGWLALAGGFQFLRGHVQICYYTWMAIGLYVIVEVVAATRRPGTLGGVIGRAFGVLAATALAFGVAAVYNIPLRDYAQHSMRASAAGGGAPIEYATSWSMAPFELPSLVLPNFVGFGNATYWGGMPFTDYPNAFIGFVIAVLAIVGWVARGSAAGVLKWFTGVLAVFALLVAMGRYFPLYGLLYDHLPLFNKFRIPVMIVILFQLATALAAAWGWSALVRPSERGRTDAVDRVLIGTLALAAVLLLLGTLGADGLRKWYVDLALGMNPRFPGEAARVAYAGFLRDLVGVGMSGLVFGAVAWFTRRGRLPVAAGSVIVLVLLLVELWPVSRIVMTPTIGDPVARNVDQGRDDIIDWLNQQGDAGKFRAFYPESNWFQDNRPAGFGVALLGGRHSAKTRLWQDLDDRRALYQLPWLALLNARYWVFSRNIGPQDVPPGWYESLQQVYVGAAGVVYEYRFAMPRAMLVGSWTVVPDTGAAVVDSITAVERNIAVHTYLTRDPGIPSGAADSVGTATVTEYGLHRVVVETEGSRPAVLRLADLYYPDWKVTVDGDRAELLRADHALRGVAVPAGRHRVVFEFHSGPFTLGLWVSIVSALAAIALLAFGAWRARRAPVPVVAPAPAPEAGGGTA
ncbi:MAG: hypothetical protein ACKO3S_12880 [bacterium]